MNIGEEQETVTIEKIPSSVPVEEPSPAIEPVPVEVPERELVPVP